MPTLHYRVVDVFTDRPFAGSPLAVVLDADDLDTAELATIARELNLPLTAFALQPTEEERTAGADYRLRVFSPGHELPFAGLASIGTACVLAALGRIEPGEVQHACGAGILPVRVGHDSVELSGAAPSRGSVIDPGLALAVAGLPPGTTVVGAPAVFVSGPGFGFLRLEDDREVTRANVDVEAFRTLEATSGVEGLGVFAWDPESRTAHCRVLTGHLATGEEAASSSAAVALGGYLVEAGLLPADGESSYSLRQGAELGRPSRLDCAVVAVGGAAVECRVSGSIAPVATGEIRRPPVRR